MSYEALHKKVEVVQGLEGEGVCFPYKVMAWPSDLSRCADNLSVGNDW